MLGQVARLTQCAHFLLQHGWVWAGLVKDTALHLCMCMPNQVIQSTHHLIQALKCSVFRPVCSVFTSVYTALNLHVYAKSVLYPFSIT
jgi:hypothetical protein